MKKKLTLILVLTMMMSCLPAIAFADDTETPDSTGVTTETGTDDTVGTDGTEGTGNTDGSGNIEEPEPTTEPEQPAKEPAPKPQNPKNTVKKVDGKLVYFNAQGNKDMKAGWKKASNGTYYSNGKALVTKPTKIKGSKKVTKKVKYYWNKKTKKWQTKKKKRAKTKIKKVTEKVTTNTLYMFGADGKLIGKKGLFKYNGKEYYGLGKGVLKTGWAAVNDKAMYFDKKTGAMAKNTKVGYLKVPASGRLGKAYALGVKKLDSTDWTLRQAYKNSYKLRYKGRWYRAKNAETYAIRGFTKGYGNCYVMASTFYIQAKLLGYDVHQVKGKVAHIWPHSWTVIRQGGKEWVYDPNFRNETKRNGWKIWYGKRGTWRYTNYRKIN